MRKIEIDEDVWSALQQQAKPFEDTPNTVLRDILFKKTVKNKTGSATNIDIIIPVGIPKALQQVLEVAYYVVKLKYSRTDATNTVAKNLNIAPNTVFDKYGRQLGKSAYEIDILLSTDLIGLQSILISKFRKHRKIIEEYFIALNDNSNK